MDVSKYNNAPCTHCDGTGRVFDDVAAGKELQALRKAKRKKLREIAALLGIGVSYLSDLEHGRRHWTTARIAEYEAACTGKGVRR